MSTLRYAYRAKQIKCRVCVNEDPTEKLIKSLQEENAKLKKLLNNSVFNIDSMTTGGIGNSGTDFDFCRILIRKKTSKNKQFRWS